MTAGTTDPRTRAMRAFHIFTVGWEPSLIGSLLNPISSKSGIHFTHGLVGDAARLPVVRCELPGIDLVALSKSNSEPLPDPDRELLASLEQAGVPTIAAMVQGDRVLRYRPERESLGYATLLARRMRALFEELQPDMVLASFDSLHAALSLAVAKSLGIPWAAMSFPVIPNNLTGFCKGVTPDTLVPIVRTVDDDLLRQAEAIVRTVREKSHQVVAYRPPESLVQRTRQLLHHAGNLVRRIGSAEELGVDRFTFPTKAERLGDIVRRSVNRRRLPTSKMVMTPPATRFVFFPLQMAPESAIDTWAPFYQNQLALISQLLLAIPADVELIVKLHFSDPDNYTREQLLQLTRLPRLRIAHPGASSHAFLERASLVSAIQGTASLEAALLGKPVLLFGDSPYLHFPRTERARRLGELHEQIRHMLERPAPRDEEVVNAYAAYMARYMPGRVNDWSRPVEPDAHDRLTDCFRALRAYVQDPANRAQWYGQPPAANGRFEAESRECR